jgi:hypothetical protein
MERKYKFASVDTSNGLGGQRCITFRFAPVSFYGIEGVFDISYDNDDTFLVRDGIVLHADHGRRFGQIVGYRHNLIQSSHQSKSAIFLILYQRKKEPP